MPFSNDLSTTILALKWVVEGGAGVEEIVIWMFVVFRIISPLYCVKKTILFSIWTACCKEIQRMWFATRHEVSCFAPFNNAPYMMIYSQPAKKILDTSYPTLCLNLSDK